MIKYRKVFRSSKILCTCKIHVTCTIDFGTSLMNYLMTDHVLFRSWKRSKDSGGQRLVLYLFCILFTSDIMLGMQVELNTFKYSVIH